MNGAHDGAVGLDAIGQGIAQVYRGLVVAQRLLELGGDALRQLPQLELAQDAA